MATDYGTDLNLISRPDGLLDFSDTGDVISGEDLLIQAVIIRLTTDRGSVLDAPDDGINLTDWLSRGMTLADAGSLSGVIENEILKDERFVAVRASVDISNLITAQEFMVTLELDAGDGPFPLVLSVSAAAGVVPQEIA